MNPSVPNNVLATPQPTNLNTNTMPNPEPQPQPRTGRYIYSVFHTIMSLVAIYLAFRCNKGFEIGPFLMALIFPYVYIIYVLATKGTCGVLENECVVTKP